MSKSIPFEVFAPCSLWKAADTEDWKRYRIGGIVSTDMKDHEQETVLQSGLDFSPALKNGFFNDNHSKETTGILGYPESAKRYRKGEILPDGTKAERDCTWVEGYLLPNYPKARQIWELAQALDPTDRRLRFSLQGKVTQRDPNDKTKVTRALVRHIAICAAPMNDNTRLEVLAKSLSAADEGDWDKAMTVGAEMAPMNTPMTGAGAAAVSARESLDSGLRITNEQKPDAKKKKKRQDLGKSLSLDEAIAWVQDRVPGASKLTAARTVVATMLLKQRGAI